MAAARLGVDAAVVAGAAPTVIPGIAVEQFPPETRPRDADAIVAQRAGQEMADRKHGLLVGAPLAQKGQHLIGVIVAVNPLESARVTVAFVQGRELGIRLIQIADPLLDAAMRRVIQ